MPEMPERTEDRDEISAGNDDSLMSAAPLTRVLFLLAALIVLLGGSLAWKQYRTDRALVMQRYLRDAQNTASVAEQLLEDRIDTLMTIAASPALRAADRAAMKDHFDAIIAGQRIRTGSLGWIDRRGLLSVSTNLALDAPRVDLSDRDYFRTVMRTRAPTISAAVTSRVTNRPIVVIAVPTFDHTNGLNGVATWGSFLDRLDIDLRAIAGDNHTTILDRNGMIILGRSNAVPAPPSPAFALAARRARRSGVIAASTGPTGTKRRLVAFATVPSGQWLVVRDTSSARAFWPGRSSLVIETTILAGFALAIAVLGWRTHRSLTLAENRTRLALQRKEALRSLAANLTRAVSLADVAQVMTRDGTLAVEAAMLNVAATADFRPPGRDAAIPMALSPSLSQSLANQWTVLPSDVATPMRDAMTTATVVFVRDGEDRARYYPHLADSAKAGGITASASYPLVDSAGQVVGCIGFGWKGAQPFDLDQLTLLETAVQLCGQALERATLFDREQIARRRAEALQQLGTELTAAISTAEVAQVMVTKGVDALGGTAATLSAVSVTRPNLELLASHGYNGRPIPSWATWTVAEASPPTDAIRTGRPTVVTDLRTGSYQAFGPEFEAERDRSWIALPLAFGDTSAVLVVELRGRPEQQIAPEPALIAAVAAQGAQAFARVQRYEAALVSADRARLLALAISNLASAETRAEVASAFARSLPLLRCSGGVLAAVDGARTALDVVHMSGLPQSLEAAGAPVPLGSGRPLAIVTSSGIPLFISHQDDLGGLLHPGAVSVLTTDQKSWAVLPLATGGGVIGAAGLFFATPQSFDDEQRIDLSSFAALCANSLARADRFEVEHEIAATLQSSLLPLVPGRIGESLLAGRYRPGTRNVSIGGDWFQAIELEGERFMLVIGDVVGHGIRSAAAMGKLSTATRALAPLFEDPAALLDQLDRVATGDPDTRFATMAVLYVDPRGGVIRTSLAGHPPPILRTADGSVVALDTSRGSVLGGLSARRTQSETRLDGPATVVLYTDGLSERRTEHVDDRTALLLQVVATSTDNPSAMADAILLEMLDGAQNDDVALLCVAIKTGEPTFQRTFSAEFGSLGVLRADLRHWLGSLSLSGDDVDDVLLAVGEAVTNAIEHGHSRDGRPIDFHAHRRGSSFDFTISDGGRWQAARPNDGQRGRGLVLMRSLMDDVTIDKGQTGTVVTLTKAAGRKIVGTTSVITSGAAVDAVEGLQK